MGLEVVISLLAAGLCHVHAAGEAHVELQYSQ